MVWLVATGACLTIGTWLFSIVDYGHTSQAAQAHPGHTMVVIAVLAVLVMIGFAVLRGIIGS
jgi:hypothetical protein